MEIKLTFLGAAGNVTGSRYLLEANGKKILVDCGFFQEWKWKSRNYDAFAVDPSKIDTVLLTHAHLDHCGLLPKLVKEGFAGHILCTRASAGIATIIMLDSGRIQEEDTKYKNQRHADKGRPADLDPLYTYEDGVTASEHLKPVPMEEAVEIGEGITATWYESGHILGACSIIIRITQDGETRDLLFSGDIGRPDAPFLRDPTLFDEADYVIMESTYGNREHEPNHDIPNKLEKVINDTFERGGNVIIPSFAVERCQELLYLLSELRHEKKVPSTMVFVDSPMAIRVTEIFKKSKHLFDEETCALLKKGLHPVDFPGLVMTHTVEQSKSINQIRGSCIIIAGSGMCTGGRIKHHLRNNIGHEESTILFVGYQAEGTLGRTILEGADEIRLFGDEHKVEARVEKINGFSGHAGRSELHAWISNLKKAPRKVFITHGEPRAAGALATWISEELGYETETPEYRQCFQLD